MAAPTFPQALTDALRTDPGRPFVTFYDEATGERVELSVATYANWVAKASSLLVDEHGLERGDTVRIDLPPHWLTAVFLGAAWNTGLVVTDAAADVAPDVVVCGPATVEQWAASGTLTLACSLLPLGVRFRDPIPEEAHDVGIEVWGQPDSFVPWDPPTEPLAGTPSSDRVLTTTLPGELLAEALLGGGSLVLVVGGSGERLDEIAHTERVTTRR